MAIAGEEGVDDGSEEIELPEPKKVEGEEEGDGAEEAAAAKASGRLAEGGEGEEGGENADGGTDSAGRPKKTSKQRREERRSSERRIREERDFLLSQNREILERLAQVETSGLDSRLLVVDSRLNECLNDAAQAEALEVEALAAKNTEQAIQFRKVGQAARGKANFLDQEKTRLAQAQAAQKARPSQPAPVPGAAEVAQHAAQYRADKAWLQFDQNGRPANPESFTALAIDAALQKEGSFDPRDQGYWQELNKRVKSALPRFFGTESQGADDDDDEDDLEPAVQQRQPVVRQPAKAAAPVSGRKGPAVGSSGSQQAAAPNSFRLSKERIDALKEIGEWDTPTQRKEWASHYAKWDKEHS